MNILLAVSGGVDSMYLANRAPDLFPGSSFAVAHCNFSLRGDESDGDEAFVRDWCQSNGIDCFVRRFDTAGYAAANHVSIEMAARELRYSWFAELCREHGFDTLCTAHNSNDNAETLILNLLRGTGSKGLRGISGCTAANVAVGQENRGHPRPRKREGPADGISGRGRAERDVFCPDLPLCQSAAEDPVSSVRIVRPLIDVTRKEIEEWMTNNGKQWREDSTNKESTVKRNVIRNDVFPIFERINPSFVQTLNADIRRFSQVDDIAEDYYIATKADVCDEKGIIIDKLLRLKHWQYMLFRLTEDCGFCQETFAKLVQLMERFKDSPRGTVTLGGKTFEGSCRDLRAVRGHLTTIEK